MRELDIPGLSVAISKNEQLKYAAGNYLFQYYNKCIAFGYGNIRKKELVTPLNQFRVGSGKKFNFKIFFKLFRRVFNF